MKSVLGVLMVAGGILLGLYVGVWLMFIGGIVGVIEIFQSGNVQALPIAINVAKVFFATFVGTLSAYLLVIPGLIMLSD